MKKRIAVLCSPLLMGYGLHQPGHPRPDCFVTPLGALDSNWDFNKLFGAMLPNHANAVYPIISWLLALKNKYTAELAIKGSFLLHIANQFSTHTPSDFDAVLVISGSRNNREDILQTMLSRTAQIFGYQEMPASDILRMLSLKITRNDNGFSLKTASGFYSRSHSPMYGKPGFPDYLPIDIDIVITEDNPRETMLKAWTMDSLVTSHRLVYPSGSYSEGVMLSREIPLPIIDALLAKKILLVGPVPHTVDLFRLIKFRQRGYALVEPNLEKKCIANTLSSFTDISVQDRFLQRSKGVLTAITKQQDMASLTAFCDIFDKLHRVLVSGHVHERMHASLSVIKNEAQRALDRLGIAYQPPETSFSTRAETLSAVFGQLDTLHDQPQLLALAGYVLIADLSDTAPETIDADVVVTAIYRYLDPKDFREQQIADMSVLACLKHFGVNVSDTVFEAIENPGFFPTQSLAAHDHTVLSLLAERGSYPARFSLKKYTFFEKKEHAILARKQCVFHAIRHDSATSKPGHARGAGFDTKSHPLTVGSQRGRLLNRLQRLYKERCQIAIKEILKTAFINFKDSVNATYVQNLKASFLEHLATTGFVADSPHKAQNLQKYYEKFLKKSLSQTAVLQELETFIDRQIPAITFIRNTLKKDISDIFLAKSDLRFLSQDTWARLYASLGVSKKRQNPIGPAYWAVRPSVLDDRIKELETHSQKKSGLTDKFCEFFYAMVSKNQHTYIRHFAEKKTSSWAMPILKALLLKDPERFVTSFSRLVASDRLVALFAALSPDERKTVANTLFKAQSSADARVVSLLEHAQMAVVAGCFQSGSTPEYLLNTFGRPLFSLITKPEFEKQKCSMALRKCHANRSVENKLRGIRGTAIVLICTAVALYRHSDRLVLASTLFLMGIYCLSVRAVPVR